MAHNFVLLFIPREIEKDGLAEYVINLFLPFGREYDFPSLEYPCDCNGLEESLKFANQNTQHFHQYWRTYNTLSPANRPAWKDYIKDWETALLALRLNKNTSDSNCNRCQGTGYFTSSNYPLNMYDYWLGLKGEYLGNIAELKSKSETREMPKGRQSTFFWLIPPSHKPFMFYHVVMPDGLPFNRWDYNGDEKWHEVWRILSQQWKGCNVIRCLVHN